MSSVVVQWTAEEDELLSKLWADGVSAGAIGARFGRSKNSIIGRAHRIDLARRPSPIANCKPARKTEQKAPSKGRSRSVSATLPPLASSTGKREAVLPPKRAETPIVRSRAEPIPPRPAFEAPTREPSPRQCQWLDGNRPFVQCAEQAMVRNGVRHVYCAKHHARSVVKMVPLDEAYIGG